MNKNNKKLLKLFIWCFVLFFPIALLAKPIFMLSVDDLLWYYLLIPVPFIAYVMIGETIKIYTKNMPLVYGVLLISSPIISIIFTSIYLMITSTGGYQFGPAPIIILMALIHFFVGLISSIVIYHKG